MRAAKVIWSNNGWTVPLGTATHGVMVNGLQLPYMYGLEEFLFNEQLLQYKIGYLNCYRNQNIPGIEDVLLITLTPDLHQVIVIGIIRHVQQLRDHEKIQIWNNMQQANYVDNIVNPAFLQIEHRGNNEQAIGTNVFVQNNYGNDINNLPLIRGGAPNGFFVNLRYKTIELFPEGYERRVNLTNIDEGVNSAWNKLSILYYLDRRPLISENLNNLF